MAVEDNDPLLSVIDEMTEDVQRLRELLGREPTKAETLTMFSEKSGRPPEAA